MTVAVSVASRSEEETISCGRRLAGRLRGGELVSLAGDLGTGKTVFVRGLAEGLGIDPREVTSPSFSLVQRYEGRLTLVHVDLYRLGSADELREESIDELRRPDSVVAVEWAERLGALIAADAIRVLIRDEGDDRRSIQIDWPEVLEN
ncbi:MAG: tRNA (adenosine(37)-N6)-threonylcarbamoyltransferase complex ATPase subunit type 1 TsaE [Nitrospirota bacterium]